MIHNNKLEQAENWFLEFTAKVNKRIIVISGPAGCGKTSLFKSLCRKYDINAIDGYTIDEHHRPSHQGSRHKKTRYSYPSLAFSSLEENSISHRLSGDLIYFDDLPNMECNAIIENLLEDLEDSTFSLAFLVTDPSGGSSLNSDNLLRRILEFPKGTFIKYIQLMLF